MTEHDLDAIYREAQSALKGRDYVRASELLRQILQIDENYKDTSRLLAQMVKLRRRRWYSHPLLWSSLGIIALIGLGIIVFPRIQGLYASQIPPPKVAPTATLLTAITPTILAPTATVVPLPTPIPLVWKRLSMGLEFNRDQISAIVQDPNDKDVLYIRTERAGVYQSIDGGVTWQPSLKDIPPGTNPSIPAGLRLPGECVAFASDSNNDSIAYCGVAQGIFRTSDMGNNWELSNPKVEWVKAIIISSANPKVLYAGGTGFSISEDGGQTWKQSNNGLGATNFELLIYPKDIKVLYVHYFRDYYKGAWDIYKSVDGGRNWESFNSGYQRDPNYGWVTRDIDFLFISMDGTMYNPNGGVLYRSQDGGATWTIFRNGGGLQIVNHPQNPSAVYILSPNFMEFSLDGGGTWTTSVLAFDWYTFPRLYFTSDSDVMYAASNSNVAISKDMGKHWTFCSTTRYAPFSDSETKFAVSPEDSNKIFLATIGQGVIVSEDGCALWHQSNAGLTNQNVNTLVIDPNNPDTLYAGTDGGAYISIDGGQTWGQINNGLLGATVVYSIVVDNDSNVYAATPYGIFKLEGK